MAGSYKHISRFKAGQRSFGGVDLLDNLRDAYEALEECYDMIEWLSGGDPDRIAEAWMNGHLIKRRPDLDDGSGYSARAAKMEQEYARKLVTEDE